MIEIDAINAVPGSELIQGTFLFKYFTFDETIAMSGICRKVELAAGDRIIEEGSLGQGLYLVMDGEVRVYKGEGDSEQELAVLGRGQLFGEMSLIENDLTSASVAARGNVNLLMIARRDFEDLLETNRDLALKVYKTFCHTLSERLRKTSEELTRVREACENGA